MTRITPVFSPNAIELLGKRYLQPDESPEGMLERVSGGYEEFYNLMARLDFLPNSPTLFNKGVPGAGTFSACFKFDVQDSLESIMEVGRKAAFISKWGGGVGYTLSAIRPKGTPIATTHGKAMGPVKLLSYYHSIGGMITQAGKRDMAQMGILHCDHPDIREFIHCKDENPQELSTFNISVAITDEFMRRALSNQEPEASLFNEIVQSAWKTGDPGCYFIDASERTNPTPHLGLLTGTNPCGEVPLLDNEPCNLGSINVANFVTRQTTDWDRLGEAVSTATRFLDHILDCNNFPVEIVTQAALRTRKLGLGVMGWADALALMHVDYDSAEAVQQGNYLMYFVNKVAREESERLAKSKGSYPGIAPTATSIRNATRTCIAPTGSISILANCSSGIEPHFALSWTRYVGAERTPMRETIPVMDRLGEFHPKITNEIAWQWHIEHQAAFQAHCDLAVSKTINMANSATIEDVRGAYVKAWELGCKGTTIFRDGCRDFQVLNADVAAPLLGNNAGCAECGGEVIGYEGCFTCINCGVSYCTS